MIRTAQTLEGHAAATPAAPDSGPHYTILALGFAKWWGSDARALAQSFRRLGHNVLDIDEEDYLTWRGEGVWTKAARRLLSRVWVREYNQSVLNQARASLFDFVLVYKGRLLQPQAVQRLRESGKPVYNFYPDVSFTDHGPHIPATLRHYDCVFTTKSYHREHANGRFQIKELRHVRHGFDPEVHRPVHLTPQAARHYGCDVSFVGCWSPEKEETISYILERLKGRTVKVFGIGWKYAAPGFKRRMGPNLQPGVFGDELAMVYRTSGVNLGLLSRARGDAGLKDLTTARTFQIPATNSFMLHEDTPEVRELFRAGEEVMLFKDGAELVERLDAALGDDALRASIAERGYRRCVGEPYDYSSAARSILNYYNR